MLLSIGTRAHLPVLAEPLNCELRQAEVHGAAPGTIATVIPGLDPPAVVATAQRNPRRRDRARAGTADRRGIIPFGMGGCQRTIAIDPAHPQVIPGGIIHLVPGIGGRRIGDAG